MILCKHISGCKVSFRCRLLKSLSFIGFLTVLSAVTLTCVLLDPEYLRGVILNGGEIGKCQNKVNRGVRKNREGWKLV